MANSILPDHYNGRHIGCRVDLNSIYIITYLESSGRRLIEHMIPTGKCVNFSECGAEFFIDITGEIVRNR